MQRNLAGAKRAYNGDRLEYLTGTGDAEVPPSHRPFARESGND